MHIESVHLNIKKFRYEICNYASVAKSKLKGHFESVHSKIKKYKCAV